MASICICIPSHIRHDNGIDNFRKCLDSLHKQKVDSSYDIFVSVSYEKQYYIDLMEFIKEYSRVKFIVSPTRKYQMEHLCVLEPMTHKYDLVMFCDDDDCYLDTRVQTFINCYVSNKLDRINPIFIRDCCESMDFNEYWRFGIQSLYFKLFCDICRNNPNAIKNNFADLFFVKCLDIMTENYSVTEIYDDLYEYTDNTKSITREYTENDKKDDKKSDLELCSHIRNVFLETYIYSCKKSLDSRIISETINDLLLEYKTEELNPLLFVPEVRDIEKMSKDIYSVFS